MRIIHTDTIIEEIKQMCIEANLVLSDDMKQAVERAEEKEESQIGKKILGQLKENMEVARKEQIPICQDTGMAIVFIRIGQEVHIEGMNIEEAINEGIRRGYKEGYLRKSVVKDPFIRENTKDNTPGIIHYEMIPGDKIELVVAPKGFGSENMSRIYMLKPADGIEGVKEAVMETVKLAGPNACPPIVVGVGIGGSFEKCAYLAKKALTREVNQSAKEKHIQQLEADLLEEINKTGIGPGGLGGRVTALAVNIETYPTHIAGLPVAINICCHVNRHMKRVI
ncbi:fumarate hydratase [Velocimicrobium porci]|uniref:Fumarate hydratase n=1 Tax=Velocimicrobium porci TaxID=2606634 RepID=A0A6L5XYE1_9FIRM|nr:fumarate hydratase [Velocimicrobium porci]MSS62973.1 fumarate hydratase [Velocimicrobium porci]